MLTRFRLDFGADERNAAWCAAAHPNRSIIATGHWDNTLRLWDITLNPPRQLTEWKAHAGHVCDIAFPPDGNQLASVGWDNKTLLWTFETPDDIAEPTRRELGNHEDIVRSVAWSANGRFLASGGEDGQILLWDVDTANPAISLVQPEDGPATRDSLDSKTVGTLQFSHDETRLLSGDAKGRLTVWSLDDHGIEKRWQLPGWIWDAKFSPDESSIATANYDGTIYLLRTLSP